jgi:hypothetical protein
MTAAGLTTVAAALRYNSTLRNLKYVMLNACKDYFPLSSFSSDTTDAAAQLIANGVSQSTSIKTLWYVRFLHFHLLTNLSVCMSFCSQAWRLCGDHG